MNLNMPQECKWKIRTIVEGKWEIKSLQECEGNCWIYIIYVSTQLSAIWLYIMYTIKGITISRNNTTRYKMRLGIMKRKEKVNSHSASSIVSISHCYIYFLDEGGSARTTGKRKIYMYTKYEHRKKNKFVFPLLLPNSWIFD